MPRQRRRTPVSSHSCGKKRKMLRKSHRNSSEFQKLRKIKPLHPAKKRKRRWLVPTTSWLRRGGTTIVRRTLANYCRRCLNSIEISDGTWRVANSRARMRPSMDTRMASHSVSFSPDGKRIASGSRDNTIRLWDASTGEELQTLKGHTLACLQREFQPGWHAYRLGKWSDGESR